VRLGSLVGIPPILEPTFVFPLETPPDGWAAEPGLLFAGSPPMLYVAEPVWNVTWREWLVWNSPSIAAVALGVTLALAVWWLVRVWRRPRQMGLMYCRVCNHELKEPQVTVEAGRRASWANSVSKCPECGTRHKKGPVVGRASSTRVWPILVVASVVIGVSVFTLATTLQRFRVAGLGLSTWPIAGLDQLFGNWALTRKKPMFTVESVLLIRIDPRTGMREEIGRMGAWKRQQFRDFITRDGKFAVGMAEDSRGLVSIDLANRKRIEFPRGRAADGSVFQLLRLSIDGKRMLVDRRRNIGKEHVHDLLYFDPAKGEVEQIASLSLIEDSLAPGESVVTGFILLELADGVVWAHLTSVRNATGGQERLTIRWVADGIAMKRTEPSGTWQVEISGDGKSCFVFNQWTRSRKKFQFLTGTDVEDTGHFQRQGWEWSGPRKVGLLVGGTAQVASLKKPARTVGLLSVSTRGWQHCGSEDGRFAAGWKERRIEPSWLGGLIGAPPTDAAEVLVWDFEKLLDSETELPIGAAASKSAAP
jgi:hypothetical protein